MLSLQSCPTLWDTMDFNPPGSSVLGILRARLQGELPCPPPGDLPDPESNLHLLQLLHYSWILYCRAAREVFANHFSGVWLCATPETAAHQAPPSLGFSRQEHWSRLPFPSPMHESEKWKWSRLVVSDPQQPRGLQPTRLLCTWDFPGKSTGVECHCLLQGKSLEMCKWWFTFQIFQRWIWKMLETLDSPWIRYWISTKVARIFKLVFYNPWPEGDGHGER